MVMSEPACLFLISFIGGLTVHVRKTLYMTAEREGKRATGCDAKEPRQGAYVVLPPRPKSGYNPYP